MQMKARKIIFSLFVFLSLTALLPLPLLATTLAQYREKVSDVYDLLDYLSYPEEDLSEAENLAEQRANINKIRAMIPATDKIETTGGSFEVDNRWLYRGLELFETEKPESPNRTKIIEELSDKLAALETKLIELENQKSAERSKDEDKRKLSEILKRPEYQKPEEKKESFIQKAIAAFFDWLKKLFPQPNIGEPDVGQVQPYKPILQIVVLLIALGIIGFLIYRFAPVLFKSFRQRERSEKETRVILGETLAADETSQNLFSEAENLARAGDLRAAIRKGYIAFLCELSDRKIIGLARHKTNRDYLRDVRQREILHREMNGLTMRFERFWYGSEKIGSEDWDDFRKQYKETIGKSV
jgi:hypothetical protein